MKHVFVGDIHGKVDQVKRALDMDGKKIFVGDFIDSFDHGVEDHRKCYELVLDACDKGEAQAIFGNHELSYLMPNLHQCSGWDVGRSAVMLDYQDRINQHFKPFIMLGPLFLVTHAGLSGHVWGERPLDTLEVTLGKWWHMGPHGSPIHHIGRTRGGIARWGGIFWCHYPDEFKPIPGLTQVFGHTRGRKIRQDGTNYCIDCLDYEHTFLEMEIDDDGVVHQ